jgi:hypothetical protein
MDKLGDSPRDSKNIVTLAIYFPQFFLVVKLFASSTTVNCGSSLEPVFWEREVMLALDLTESRKLGKFHCKVNRIHHNHAIFRGRGMCELPALLPLSGRKEKTVTR